MTLLLFAAVSWSTTRQNINKTHARIEKDETQVNGYTEVRY